MPTHEESMETLDTDKKPASSQNDENEGDVGEEDAAFDAEE